MKIFAISFAFSALLLGQAPPAVQVAPGAPAVKAPGEVAPASSNTAQAAPMPPDTVVAEVNGTKYTVADFEKIIAMLPPQYQASARSQPQMLGQFFLMRRLAEDAAKAGLDQKEPFKDQLEMQRMQVLSTAELSEVNNTMQITEADQRKYFEENPDKFKQVKVRVIYKAFNPTPGKAATDGKPLVTEAEAKAQIEDLAKQIRAGADFGKLAHDLSDDKASAAKDGDFGVINQDSAYPQAIRDAVFALKQGDISAPIRQPNGFYLIRAEEVAHQPFNESVNRIIQTLKQTKFQDWMKSMQAQYTVKVENQAYFAPRVPTPAPAVH